MPEQTATATGADLSTVLTAALADLVDDDDVRVEVDLPEGVALSTIEVELGADVAWDDDESDEDAVVDVEVDVDLDESDDVDESDEVDEVEEVQEEAPAPVSDDDGDDAAPLAPLLSEEELEQLDEEADAGADFVEGLLDAMDLPGELQIRVLEDTRRAEVEVVDMNSGALIGRRGSTLEAIQELMRCALQSQFERRVHVHVDVEGYRARRLEKLLDKADEAIDNVLDTGEPERLEPMDVFERKAIHEFVNTVDGVLSRSHGREPSRRVVIDVAD